MSRVRVLRDASAVLRITAFCALGSLLSALALNEARAEPTSLDRWRPGVLDLHHINTGRGNATFVIFPDGTTLLIDAGEFDASDGGARYLPAQIAPARPNETKRPAAWLTEYIQSAAPSQPARLDYALITHFHSDHYGEVTQDAPLSRSAKFKLTGITAVGDSLPIAKLIDRSEALRALPACVQGKFDSDVTYRNYRAFVSEKQQRQGLRHEPLSVGSRSQIVSKYAPEAFPEFYVRGIKAGEVLWTGRDTAPLTRQLFDVTSALGQSCTLPENPLSLALTIHYGPFTYFSGGDNTGLSAPGVPAWMDVETPIAAVVGPVDVLTLNHHGNRDATNSAFLTALRPRAVIQQSWISDQPGGEVVHRLASRALYPSDRLVVSTHVAPATHAAIGRLLSDTFSSTHGHILVRVAERGQTFTVHVLDDRRPGLQVLKQFGPFTAHSRPVAALERSTAP